ncbi:MAG: substrate-binding domain-containing protein [Rudaea sp.]|uniref:PstS family phosphate ABC transporter substrate-binding protein n=1 Tax=Rudaea sp. TaxID=2136325 RepID=UPI0039E60E13
MSISCALSGISPAVRADAQATRAQASFDAGDLPAYESTGRVSGTIRNAGFGLGGVLKKWEDAFRKLHPDVQFDDKLPTSDYAIPALVTGSADLGPDGGEPSITETLSFFEVFGYHVTAVVVATGAYEVEGRSNGLIVYVNRDNPIRRLTLKQLDGIFGAERNGGLDGFKWMLGRERGREGDIRTWGQLGLKGEWTDAPIQTYGHAPSGTSRFFQLKVLGNSDKWNPNYREYVETGSKMIGSDDPGQRGGLQHMLADELAHDKFGIAWTVEPQARKVEGLRAVALAESEAGPYVAPSRQSFQNRSYPLARNIYIYLNRAPRKPVEPRLREFLRFILSREGQQILADDGNYLPLTSKLVREERAKLD